jgi:hypothetical protein
LREDYIFYGETGTFNAILCDFWPAARKNILLTYFTPFCCLLGVFLTIFRVVNRFGIKFCLFFHLGREKPKRYWGPLFFSKRGS